MNPKNTTLMEKFGTEVTSFGETLRQINTYKGFYPGNYVLVTPKTPFKEAFEQSGVRVYEI